MSSKKRRAESDEEDVSSSAGSDSSFDVKVVTPGKGKAVPKAAVGPSKSSSSSKSSTAKTATAGGKVAMKRPRIVDESRPEKVKAVGSGAGKAVKVKAT